MMSPVYNSGIPHAFLNTVNRTLQPAFAAGVAIFIFLLSFATSAGAVDWSTPEQELARKIVAVTGPGAIALTINNRSSLSRRDSDIVSNGLRAALEVAGLRFAKADQSAATIAITLSENPEAYVWVAEIRQGTGEPVVVMTSVPQPEGSVIAHDAPPLALRKVSLWSQQTAILDVLVLEEGALPTHIAVLEPEKVALYRWQGNRWQQDQTLALIHSQPWPRDLRGRLIPSRDHLFDAYLPGVLCRSTAAPPIALSCRASDDPWPLTSAGLNDATGTIPFTRAFFAPTRNFFTGALTPKLGRVSPLPKFYSAAAVPLDKYVLWLLAGVDGQTHMIDGMSDQTAKLGWGSDLAGLRTSCGAGWQVLAASSGDPGGDSVRAYEFPGRDPVAVTAAADFAGDITALWTEAKGDTAIAVARSRESGSYEAFRLALACNQ